MLKHQRERERERAILLSDAITERRASGSSRYAFQDRIEERRSEV